MIKSPFLSYFCLFCSQKKIYCDTNTFLGLFLVWTQVMTHSLQSYWFWKEMHRQGDFNLFFAQCVMCFWLAIRLGNYCQTKISVYWCLCTGQKQSLFSCCCCIDIRDTVFISDQQGWLWQHTRSFHLHRGVNIKSFPLQLFMQSSLSHSAKLCLPVTETRLAVFQA